ncbi:MAG: RNA polymerase sigma factor [Bacteroidales bacterium]|nr:RNA polymerase sigma factor [Bacteroidales bacterium]
MKINRQEIERIYGEHSRRLYLASLRILGNSQEAEDVVQDTILKVCTDSPSTAIDNIGAYLTRCCVNRSLDIIRKRQTMQYYRTEMTVNPNQQYQESPSEQGGEKAVIARIIGQIAKLPSNLRQIVSLKLIEGYDYEEIAQITSMKESSIRSRYMRGRQRLASMLKKEGIYERF